MSKLIALKSGTHEILSDAWHSDFSNLKQQALLFDQIGIYKLSRFYESLEESLDLLKKLNPKIPNEISSKTEAIITELEWLKQTGIIFEVNLQDVFQDESTKGFAKKVSAQKFEDAKNLLKKIIENQTPKLINNENNARKDQLSKEQHYTLLRLMSIIIETTKGITTVTTLPHTEYSREAPNFQKGDVVQIVIRKLPLPNNETPWEQLIDYRNDPENQRNLLNLRRWIRKVSSENLQPAETEEELEWLINEFQNHMKIHRMKANTETLEVIVKAPLKLLELEFSKITEPLFALKKRQINLMEAELNAPGREMAYIIKAKDTF
ncbi:MAG: hypothetical protein PHQ36_01845 [Anaerolineales bacterium]|nr:hypothetical protein [Anaerolineales bacterium]